MNRNSAVTSVGGKILMSVFALGTSLTLAANAPKPQVDTNVHTQADVSASEGYVEQAEQRIKEIDQEVVTLEKNRLEANEKETLVALKKKQEEAKSKIVDVKAAPVTEKTEKVRELSETMSDVEQLFVKLDSRNINPSE